MYCFDKKLPVETYQDLQDPKNGPILKRSCCLLQHLKKVYIFLPIFCLGTHVMNYIYISEVKRQSMSNAQNNYLVHYLGV